jgi:preprotein translocase subunit YajC
MLLPFIVLIGAMFVMTRSAKNKQRQAVEMRNQMVPGSGVRTIGGMYAVVKEAHDDVVLLELTDGVHVHFAKNAIGAVLDENEFNRIVHGIEPEDDAHDDEGADAISLDKDGDTAASADGDADTDTAASADSDGDHVTLSKTDDTDTPADAPTSNGAESK